ncbi:hypothetical protein D3C76_1329070 [compost metagenome]
MPTLQRPQAGQEYRRLDGFDHVVVGTGFQAEDMVHVIFLGRQNHDRRISNVANPAAHLQPTLPRQHQVEHHHFGLECQKRRQRQVASVLDTHLEAMLREKLRDQSGEPFVILHQQHFARTQVIHNNRPPTHN